LVFSPTLPSPHAPLPVQRKILGTYIIMNAVRYCPMSTVRRKKIKRKSYFLRLKNELWFSPVLRIPHHIDPDPDPAYHFDADLDADPDPACHFDADPDTDPSF
jgi:hypothetical protein